MIRWLLDDRPFDALARAVNSVEIQWPTGLLHVVDHVAHAAKLSPARQRLLDLDAIDGKIVQVHDIVVGSAAESFIERLRPNHTSATKDLGEHASIAYCATIDPNAVFVTQDKGAAYLALAELGRSRVASPFDLWHDLYERGLLLREQAHGLHAFTAKGDNGLVGLPARLAPMPVRL